MSREIKDAAQVPLNRHIDALVHAWFRTVLFAGALMFPAFWLLDFIVLPHAQAHLLGVFALYRVCASVALFGFWAALRASTPSRLSILYGYAACATGSLSISLMTVHLGGFNSPYYAGLILVQIMIGTVPWAPLHSALNGLLVISVFLLVNQALAADAPTSALVSNLYFLVSCGIAVTIWSHVRHRLTIQEYLLRAELNESLAAISKRDQVIARDLEEARKFQQMGMEAEKIPQELQPHTRVVQMSADVLAGDIKEITKVAPDHYRVLVADVTGHGTQAALRSMTIKAMNFTLQDPTLAPWNVLALLNEKVSDAFGSSSLVYCASCVDLIRESAGWKVKYSNAALPEMILLPPQGERVQFSEYGTFQGFSTKIEYHAWEHTTPLGSRLILFTDGLPEAKGVDGSTFGYERAIDSFAQRNQSIDEAVERTMQLVKEHGRDKPFDDDITVIAIDLV